MYLVTAREMKEMDRLTMESFGLPGRLLMEAAGRGAVRFFFEIFGDIRGKSCGVAAGRGNNGGDGFVMARLLSQQGARVSIFLLANKSDIQGDAAENLALLPKLDIPLFELPDISSFHAHADHFQNQDIWVDGILGTGIESEIKPYFAEVVGSLNRSQKPIFAIDIPSGLSSDTGRPCGACIRATATATFGFPKIGHLTYPGPEYTGKLQVIDIGIPAPIENDVSPRQHLITPELAREGIVFRPPDTHKGRTGHLLLAGGSPGKTGAAALAALAALRTGAGLVTLGVPQSLNPIFETLVKEAMTLPLSDGGTGRLSEAARDALVSELTGKKCLTLGPGLGTAPETRALVLALINAAPIPMVLDADALNCLADSPEVLDPLDVPVILTPHPGEMARLSGIPVEKIQQDRITAARNFALAHRCHVVLKGAHTVIAHPDGDVDVNITGNSGMAAGGMGDVLTGVIAGLITQGASPKAACRTGVFLHGVAADILSRTAPFGFLAGEVADAIPAAIAALLNDTIPFPLRIML